MRTVLVTGAEGFVGARLVPTLVARGWRVRAGVWKPLPSSGPQFPPGVEVVVTGDLATADLQQALGDATAVVHLAGRAHRMNEGGEEHADGYERDNAEVTELLGLAALAAGVRSFVYVSSVKAMGERTPPGTSFRPSTVCRPEDPYGRSKLHAEERLRAIPGLGAVVLRPPLMYGPGVKGNLKLLWRLVRSGLPIPVGSIDNRRSLLFVGNFADAIATCLECEAARGQTFVVRDGEDLSTPELVRRIARSDGRRPRVVPMPKRLLRALARIAGKGDAASRLIESLSLDDQDLRRVTGWAPPFTIEEGLAESSRGIP